MSLAIALSSPILAFAGAYLGYRLSARSDDRLDRWRRREETMRMLRWAVEMCFASAKEERATANAAIEALLDSELLQPEDAQLVTRVAESIARTEIR